MNSVESLKSQIEAAEDELDALRKENEQLKEKIQTDNNLEEDIENLRSEIYDILGIQDLMSISQHDIAQIQKAVQGVLGWRYIR